MATNFMDKLGEIGQLIFLRHTRFRHRLEHRDAEGRVNSGYHIVYIV